MLNNLNLPPLEERRRQQRLSLFNKITEGLIPALPPENFLTPAATGRRKIRPKMFRGFETGNILQRQSINNTRGYKIPSSNTDQHKHSFFVKTAFEWNQLTDNTIDAMTTDPTSAAPSAPSGSPTGSAPTTD